MVNNSKENTRRLTLKENDWDTVVSPETENKEDKNRQVVEEKTEKNFNITINYGTFSKEGRAYKTINKINQDSFKVHYNTKTNFYLFMVCDGHGTAGDKISQFICNTFPYLLESRLDGLSNEEDILKVIQEAVLEVDSKIKKQNFDSLFSGSTLVGCCFLKNVLYSFNVGDSRALLIDYKEVDSENKVLKDKIGYPLTEDQKPERKEERDRVLMENARVAKSLDLTENEISLSDCPLRLWHPFKNIPGLAMTRAMGDFFMKPFGVIAFPEINILRMDNVNKTVSGEIIIASDGVWEFISNDEIVNVNCSEIKGKIIEINKIASERWDKFCGEDIRDDITMILIKFEIKNQ